MSALRRVTAPPIELAEAVTNSLRQDVFRTTGSFFSEPPLGLRRECQFLTQRIFFETAIPPSSPILSGFPL
jgi:hypothetical protein